MPEQRKEKIEGTVYRDFRVGSDSIVSEEDRTIELSFSSMEPVLRQSWWEDAWVEILGHDDGEVDLFRLLNGAPLLYNHERGEQSRIGVVESAELVEGIGRATVRLSKRNKLMDEFWTDIQDGILRNVSVGYQINERTLVKESADSPDEYRVTSWTPHEISIVDIPADANVGVGRSQNYNVVNLGGKEMPIDKKEEQTRSTTPAVAAAPAAAAPAVDVDAVRAEESQRVLKLEGERQASIREAFAPFESHRGLMDECVTDMQITAEQARTKLLSAIGEGSTPSARVEISVDERDKRREQLTGALEQRTGLGEASAQNEMRGYTMQEMARESLRQVGVSTTGMDKRTLMGRAISHSSSDFALVLGNTANKSMLKGYSEAPEVFDQISRAGNISDFKINDRVGMSEFGDLLPVGETDEYESGTMADRREQIQLATFGRLFSISRQALINDDLSALTVIPQKMGRAAKRKVGDLVFDVLNLNASMADGVALFHANHGNLASNASVMSVATLGAARTAMRKQTDQSGNAVLNINPTKLLVPVSLHDTALTLMTSETDFSSANSKKPNILRGTFDVISDARLDMNSATAWYLAADQNAFDTIEVGYLDGNPNPFMESKDGWNTDGVEFKVRIDAAAKALEHRTLYKNAGV